MSNHFEAVVVGAGPAGTAAAYTLASKGIRTCLIDKSEFPRDKLCGGLVTQRSKRIFESIFGIQWEPRLFTASDDVHFYAKGKELATASGYSTMYFTMRFAFDEYLVNLVRQKDVILRLGAKILSLDLGANKILLEGGEELSFQFLVGADGVNSQVARQLFGAPFDAATIGFGLEVEVPRERLPEHGNKVEIDFSAASWGYGWVFPKRESITIGVGGIHRLNPDLRARMSEYLAEKGLAISDFRVKGQYIPFGDCRIVPGYKNVLLCGDAAGVVDPITGEGISYAMQSGFLAATAIVAYKSTQYRSLISLYTVGYESITKSIKQATRWRYLIFPVPMQRVFAWAFSDASTLRHGYLDILAGSREYSELYGLLALQVWKAVKKLLRSVLSMVAFR